MPGVHKSCLVCVENEKKKKMKQIEDKHLEDIDGNINIPKDKDKQESEKETNDNTVEVAVENKTVQPMNAEPGEKADKTKSVSSDLKSGAETNSPVPVEVLKPILKEPCTKPVKPPREKRPENRQVESSKRASTSSTSSESSAVSSSRDTANIAIDSSLISVPASQTSEKTSSLPEPPSPILKDVSPTSSEDSSNVNTFGLPRTSAFGSEGPCMTETPREFVLDGEKDPWFAVKPESKPTHMVASNPEEQKVPSKKDSRGNPLIFDLPSPAAAFIYSDDDSPPSKKEATSTALTFSTFRPEPGTEDQYEQVHMREQKEPIDSMKRRSLNRVEEEEEMTSEALTAPPVESKPEPKRVSFHEDVDIGQSFHSDVSMMVMRSPVDDRDDSSFGGSQPGEHIDSGDILDTLESLCQTGSESDMTYSGSSGSESDTESDLDDNDTMAKEIYAQYAATKCLAESGKDMTIDSGVGELSEGTANTREVSPLESLEQLDALDGSFIADKDDDFKFPPPPPELQEPSDNSSSSTETEMHMPHQKRYSIDPLATLERPDIADIEYTTSESESDFEEKCEDMKPPPPPVPAKPTPPPVAAKPPPPVAAKPRPEVIKEKFGGEIPK